jgi:hypothetical protein
VGVREPQPADQRWQDERRRSDATIRAEVQRIEKQYKLLGHEEMERRSAKSGRAYARAVAAKLRPEVLAEIRAQEKLEAQKRRNQRRSERAALARLREGL